MIEKKGDTSEERLLERILRIIPGYSGYKEKEHIRDSDKRLREYLAQELDRIRKTVEGVMRDLTDMKSMGLLDDIDREVKRMQKYADNIRFANYGYAGFFSEVKIREQELQEFYAHDLGLTDQIASIETGAGELEKTKSDFSELKTSIENLGTLLDSLEEQIQKRKYMFR